jgi:hypothetical protein
MTRSVSASHLDVAVRDEAIAAQLRSALQRERAAQAQREASRPKPPPPPKQAPPKASRPATSPATAKVSTPAKSKPVKPEIPPGYLLLSPADVAVLGRLVDSHPLTKGTT